MAVAIPFILAAVAVAGSIQQSQQAKAAAKYNQQVAENNAIAARSKAAADAAAQNRQARMKLGAMRANYGASGITMEGSPIEVMAQSAAMAELDRQNILYGGEINAVGFSNTSNLEGARATNIQNSMLLNATSSGLSAYSSAGGSFGGGAGSSIKTQ